MALHTDLPIYRTGAQLLGLAVSVQEHYRDDERDIVCDVLNAFRSGVKVRSPPPRRPKREPLPSIQGGMTNAELRDAWRKKLPDVYPSERDLSAFALGVEVGVKRAERAHGIGDDQ